MSETLYSNPESIICDEEITLTPLTMNDAETLHREIVDNRAYLAEFLNWANDHSSIGDAEAFIEHTAVDRNEGVKFGFGIFYKQELIGHISLSTGSDGCLPEIGYWVSERFRGNSIAERSTKALTKYGHSSLDMPSILIRARVHNTASNRVAEKCGYSLAATTKAPNNLHYNFWISPLES